MNRWRAALWIGVRALGLALALGVLVGLAGGFYQGFLQVYAQQGYWRLMLLALRTGVQDGMLFGALLAELAALAAGLTVALTRREGAGWVAAVATMPVAAATVLVLRAGLASRFASLFPAAYASAPGISPDTVFWVFLPPLVRHIFAATPRGHALTIALLTAVVVGAASLIGFVFGWALNHRRPLAESPRDNHVFTWFAPPLAILAVAALLFTARPFVRADQSNPDVILISLDTIRADVLGAYGSAPSPSPVLDAFARRADRYARAYAPSSWTIPSHAGLLSGLVNHRHGAQTMDTRLPDHMFTLSERLAERGYDTGAFVNSFLLSPRYGFGQGFGEYVMDPESPGRRVVEQAAMWLAPRANRPVFLFVHLFDAHWPYGPANQKSPGDAGKSFHEFVEKTLNGNEQTRQYWRRRYRDSVTRADQAVGQLFAALRDSGRWDRAWVIVVSDHGEEWWDHGFLGHAVTLNEEVLRVPLLIKAPNQKAGRVFAEPVSLLDIVPTLTAVLGLPGPRGFDGRDLRRVAAGPRSIWAASAIWGEPRFALIRDCLKGITSFQWRFGRFGGERPESVFDVCADPGETQDLAKSESGLTLLTVLRAGVAAAHMADQAGAAVLSPEAKERLRSLGYLE